MGAAVPKQYLELAGRPILAHALAAFDRADKVGRIVLVVPATDFDDVRRQILVPLRLHTPIHVAAGGPERGISVANGLECLGDLDDASVVLIHDGVRPFVDAALIDRLVEAAAQCDACIPVVPVNETVKRVDEQGRIAATVDRGCLRLAQTPQAFALGVIRRAHRAARSCGLSATDDAALVEAAGGQVRTIAGSRFNLKITTAEDLALARAILAAGLWPPAPPESVLTRNGPIR